MSRYFIAFGILMLAILLGVWVMERGMDYVILHPEVSK